jgi:signal transduction histidine kinase
MAVIAIATGTAWNLVSDAPVASVLVLVVLVASIVMAHRRPVVALGLLATSVVVQIAVGAQLNPAQAFAGVTFYLVGRYGTSRAHWLGALTVILLGVGEATSVLLHGSALIELLFAATPATSGVRFAAVAVIAVTPVAAPLWAGVADQAKAIARSDEITRQHAEHALIGARAVAEAEAARAQLARDVHDTVGHALTVVITQSRLLTALTTSDPLLAAQAARSIEDVASSALEQVRQVLAGRVEASDVTVADLVELAQSASGIDVDVDVDDVGLTLPGARGDAMFHALQELLTNALRHGDPSEHVRVRMSTDGDSVMVAVVNEVREDSPASDPTGYGLAGASGRLHAVGGALHSAREADVWTAHAVAPIGASG